MSATDTAGTPIPPQHVAAVQAGAECWRCPLLNCGAGPVPPTHPPDTDALNPMEILVVAEAPGSTEVEKGQTLIGASGREIRTALRDAGAPMDRVGYTNATLCRPPDDMKRYLRTVKRQGLMSPIEACRPRLQAEIAQAKYVVLMGGASVQAAGFGSSTSVMKVRGTPLQLPNSGPPAMAIPHAAFVMRDEGRVMRPIFHADVKKAVRFSRGQSTWQDPWYFVPKTAAEVHNFLAVPRERVSVDVETDGVDQWTCNLRRVGIGTSTEVMIYAPLSVHGHLLLPMHEIQAQTRAIADYFQRAPRIDTWNGVAFDSVVLWRHGMPLPDERMFDGMVGHQIGITSELPHGLDFAGSMYTDAPRWKDDVKHSSVKSDEILDHYLSFDISVTQQSTPYVEQNLAWSQQGHIYGEDMELFRIGRSMAMLGMGINPQLRAKFISEYQEKSDRLRAEFQAAVGRDVNPDSPQQVRKLLYTDLGLPIMDEHMTDSGDPSTDESTLLDLLSLGLDERATKIVHAVLGCREAEKVLGTYVGRFENGQIVGGLPVHADGRIRVSWRPGKRSGRWGSSPNMQNIIKRLRAMFTPAPGNVFVAADSSAVELRKIALLSGDELLIKAFAEFDAGTGPDVHVANACTLFRCQPKEVTDAIRDFVKRFVYALSYDAQPPRIYQTLSLLRDDNLRPKFPHITLPEVERVFNLWWQIHPAIPAWKKRLIYTWRRCGYIETEYHKRRRYFIGGEKQEEMSNHPVQGSCADMQNDAIRAVVRAYPFDYTNHRGLVVNGHDQIVVECAEREAEDVKRLIEHAMFRQIKDMKFPASGKTGRDWKSVS